MNIIRGIKKKYKRKNIYAYLDGKLLCNVTKAALDNNYFIEDLK